MITEKQAMKRAIELAYKGSGYVSPNPRVGAVILKNGKIAGEGYHAKYGEAHAEVNAIENAGDIDFSDATMVVTLEPCSHFGKTPPCAAMIARKKFGRVVIGLRDPNPMVSGKGIEMLQAADIDVEVGLLEDQCRWVNRFFLKDIQSASPYVIIKSAQTIDGCIATSRGKSKWITCEESRRRGHLLRAEVDAIMIGRGTAVADNPSLTVRSVKGANPLRFVLDSKLQAPLSAKLFNELSEAQTVVCCNTEAATTRKAENLKLAGVIIESFEADDNGHLPVAEILKRIYQKHTVRSLLVEGGGELQSAFVREELADELQIFIAPIFIGGGKQAFGTVGYSFVNESPKYNILSVSKSDTDIHMVAVKPTE